MNRTQRNTSTFTLIELLMVIAIIGILAGILIPTVGAVKSQANKAASKSQLSNYITAIQLFKGEYAYYPFVSGEDEVVDLSTQSTLFIETLSGRDASSGGSKEAGNNRRRIAFHSFSESEFFYDDATEATDPTQLADRFNNVLIKVMIDGDGNGFVAPAPETDGLEPKNSGGKLRTGATAWVEEGQGDEEGAPAYSLWD